MKKKLRSFLNFIVPDSIRFARSVKERDLQEQELLSARESFYRQFVREGDLVFDVGANIGNRIEPMIRIGAHVVAVEPQQKCIKVLQSRFGDKIDIVPMGLGEQESEMDFYMSTADTISSFSRDWIDSVKNDRFKNYSWSKPRKVAVTTLDLLIKKYGAPQFVKIDVEGFELEVLKGLAQPVKTISFEYMVPEQLQRVKDCLAQIRKHNPGIECNYSAGESMALQFQDWISPDDFIANVDTEGFSATLFGDVYVRSKTH